MPLRLSFIMLLGGISLGTLSTKAFSNETLSCTLFFSQHCLAESVKANIPDGTLSFSTQLAAATLAIELNMPRKLQRETWPYYYREDLKNAVATVFTHPKLRDLWALSQRQNQLIKNATKPKTLAQCLKSIAKAKAPSWFRLHFCTRAEFGFAPQHIMQEPLFLALKPKEQSLVLQEVFNRMVEQAKLETAQKIQEQVVVLLATQTPAVQIDFRIKAIETLLAYGYSEHALTRIDGFFAPVSLIDTALNQLPLYRLWANFLTSVRLAVKDETTAPMATKERAGTIVNSSAHLDFLHQTQQQDTALQLKIHRHIAQAFFYSFFNSSPEHDFTLAFHVQKWQELWASADKETVLTQGFEMLLLEAKINSFARHHQRLLEGRH